ncbi:hypothetical protein Tsubulata_003079 [Turnera subulata]|uniref:NTF2 domain-containing protein n=1 Tax=Turnera subulata TaxID=218843 RepID=A0A9Q0JC23_9ROSI|nr:hypothetical protein Tsubulata_003079 [Turnera subulata]
MAMDLDVLAMVFVQHYYTTFDTSREQMAALYQEELMLAFKRQQVLGSQSIVLTTFDEKRWEWAIRDENGSTSQYMN